MKKKLMTFNVNGIRSAWGKGLRSVIRSLDVDVACLQEIRCQGENLDSYGIAGFESYFCSSKKLGYGGVGAFSRVPVLNIFEGLGVPEWDGEGRVMILEFEDFFLVNVYMPALGFDPKKETESAARFDQLRKVATYLESRKPVVICGDLNILSLSFYVHHRLIFDETPEYQRAFVRLLDAGYEDVWLMQHPTSFGSSWVPYGLKLGHRCRMDYFLVSERLLGKVCSCEIHDICGLSDHRPVILELDV